MVDWIPIPKVLKDIRPLAMVARWGVGAFGVFLLISAVNVVLIRRVGQPFPPLTGSAKSVVSVLYAACLVSIAGILLFARRKRKPLSLQRIPGPEVTREMDAALSTSVRQSVKRFRLSVGCLMGMTTGEGLVCVYQTSRLLNGPTWSWMVGDVAVLAIAAWTFAKCIRETDRACEEFAVPSLAV